eukprot:Phypoly_transcript_11191.p1 GENE.Phypoly_transcript_11191~~Phypoly_transcript_11191.p1  ORF type:complete len:388 (+),score=96.16 Phypoly_transcript_11191:40-1203(+)
MKASTHTLSHTFRSLTSLTPIPSLRSLRTPYPMLRRFYTSINSSTPPAGTTNYPASPIFTPSAPSSPPLTPSSSATTPSTSSTPLSTSSSPLSTSSSPLSTSSQSHTSTRTNNEDVTHFGFRDVPKEQKESLVGEVFKKVAGNYDIMNDVMSLGIHRLWKDQFVNTLHPTPGSTILDVAGGTGDIAFRCVEAIRKSPDFFPRRAADPAATPAAKSPFSDVSKVVVLDINPSMLEVGKERAKEKGYDKLTDPVLDWVVGNAQQLPFPDNCMDAYTIAFGIRNCTDVPAVLREAHRVLKKGGRFMCLEFSQVNPPMLRSLYDFYSFNFIPVWGQLIANDYNSYQYLVESIRKFPNQETFAQMIEDAGFSMVNVTNLTFGVSAIHSGWKL